MAFDAEEDNYLDYIDYRRLAAASRVAHVRRLPIGGELKDVNFCATASADLNKRLAACRLLNSRYAWRGYGSNHQIPSGKDHTTFTTEIDGRVVGTITLAIDSDQGLAIDRTFPDEAGFVRQEPDSKICELIKFAFDSDIRSKEVLAGLFHVAFIYGSHISRCTDLFIEVHPRHAAFYGAMLEFEAIGPPRTNVSVGAPSQLMRLKVETIGKRICDFAGTAPSRSNRSLYPYFFAPVQALQIRGALFLTRTEQANEQRSLPLVASDAAATMDTGGLDTADYPESVQAVLRAKGDRALRQRVRKAA